MFGFGDDPEVPEPPESPGAFAKAFNLYVDTGKAACNNLSDSERGEYTEYAQECIKWSKDLKEFHDKEITPEQAEEYLKNNIENPDAHYAEKYLKDIIELDDRLYEEDFAFPVDSIEELNITEEPAKPAEEQSWLQKIFSDAHDNVQPPAGQEQTMLAKQQMVPGMDGMA
jgi:hypothetical protein